MKTKLTFLTIVVTFSLTLANLIASGQESPVSRAFVDSLHNEIEDVKSEVDLLKRLKITGYIQAQWQKADTIGSPVAFSGGNFPSSTDNRFMIRRGRVKFTYDNEFSTYVLQLDATEKGLALKDAYIAVRDPWKQFVTLTAGAFDRPFGYEISYSSSARETPERSRIFQTLFPGERDLGAKITLQPMRGTKYDWIKFDAGIFGGNGVNPDWDKKKDFITHLGFSKRNRKETIKFGGGISYYHGGVYQGTKYLYYPGKLMDASFAGLIDSTSSNKNEFATRRYFGIDAQIGFQSFLGFTQIRGEYLTGTQPSLKGSNASTSNNIAPAAADLYIRNFSGGYVYFIQSIGQSKNQLVLKYDWLDPNTKVKGSDILAKSAAGKITALGIPDIKYSTIGIGWNYRFNSQVKFMVYYEFVKNEHTGLSTPGLNGTLDTTKDLKDNVFTLRVQYKF